MNSPARDGEGGGKGEWLLVNECIQKLKETTGKRAR